MVRHRLKDLFLVPGGALGNRMLAIASAKRVCDISKARCTIVWDWGPPEAIFADPAVQWVTPSELEIPADALFVRHLFLYEGGNTQNRRVPLTENESVAVVSWHIFNAAEEPALAHEDDLDLKPWLPAPVDIVQERVAAFRRAHVDETTVGMHVRRTDHVRAIQGTPDELYFREGDDLVARGHRLLLATDNHATEHAFRTRYPGKVIVYPKNPALSERMPRPFRLEDTLDDLVDLWLLGSCAFVVGCMFSTFSKVARLLNGSPRSKLLGDPTRLENRRP
jgi:hypothetical protein